MIASVVLQDLAWLVVLACLMRYVGEQEHSRVDLHPTRAFEWLFFAFCYVSLELLFHVPMESTAAWVMR